MSSMKKGLRRVAVVAVTTLVAAPALATVASATSTFAFDRLAGADRYATSVAVGASYGASTNVILASGVPGHYPDALTASYLAGFAKAPIMLTQLAATPANVIAQITASGATDVWLIGGTGVISAAQETALDAKFGTIHRLGGLDRYLTAEKVIGAAGVAKSTTALLATGSNFPDAIAGGPLSYVKGMPLAITATNTLPASTLAALKAAGVTKVIALGGPTVISAAVLATLATNGITLDQRIFGANRSETSSKLADYMITSQGFSNTAVNVASGYAFGTGADALGGAPLSGKENRPTLITESVTTVGPGPLGFLTAHAPTLTTGHIFGGVGAVSAASEAAMQAAARTVSSNQTYSVTPNTASTKTVTVGTDAAGVVQYSVCALGTTPVYVALVKPADVSVSTGGVVTFASTAIAGLADLTAATGGKITVVNGVATGGVTKTTAAVTPTNGCVTFTVDSTVAGSGIPVVFSAADANADLEVNSLVTSATTKFAPTEGFAIGGKTTWVSAEAGFGAITAVTPVSVSLSGAYFTDGATYYWDANDVFQYLGAGISMADFASMIGTGVTISGSYNPTPSGVSTFNITAVTQVAPAIFTAASVSNLDAGAYANDVKIVVAPGADDPDGTTYSVFRVKVATAATVAPAVSTFAAATTTNTVDATTGNITFVNSNVADGFYYYVVKATYPVTGTVTVSAVTPASPNPLAIAATSVGPKSAYAAETTPALLAGTVDTGDVMTFAFDSKIAVPAVGATIQVRDGDGTIVNLISGTNVSMAVSAGPDTLNGVTYAAGSGQVLVVTVTSTPATTAIIAAGTIVGLSYPLTVVDQGGITSFTGSVNWNIAGSTDKTIEQ